MNEENKSTATETEQLPATNATPADHEQGESTGKLFTQEEVNEIIKKRLSKVRNADSSPSAADVQRESALAARENRLTCREFVAENGYPADFLDILDTSDPDKFKEKAGAAFALMERSKPRFVAPLASTEGHYYGESLCSQAFKQTKHEPKQFPLSYPDD